MKILSGILLGFILHSGLNTIYDYVWWTSAYNCSVLENNTSRGMYK